MRSSFLVAVSLMLITAPALAESTAAPSAAVAAKGQMLRTIDNARLGRISRVSDNGSVEVIVDTQVRLVPASTLTSVDGKLTTSLTKQQIVSLR